MITHEEARVSVKNWQKDKTIYSYITQQEKVSKLLELYKEKDVILENINKCFNDLIQRELLLDKYKYKEKLIKALEEELK